MSTRSTKTDLSHTPARNTNDSFRALLQFSKMPAGHSTFKVRDDGSVPHLKQHEFAVVDLVDREVLHGELYVIEWQSGARRRQVVQVTRSMSQITETGPKQEVWWVRDAAGWRQVDEVPQIEGAIPVFAGLSDGPYLKDRLREKLIGRVVGFAQSALGCQLAPEAGWENEHQHNAAFDAGEYLDTLIRTGYRPYVYGKGSREQYVEELPRKVHTQEEHEAVIAVRWKYVRASKALEMVRAECMRRGLVH